jgi:hypothetical protein
MAQGLTPRGSIRDSSKDYKFMKENEKGQIIDRHMGWGRRCRVVAAENQTKIEI